MRDPDDIPGADGPPPEVRVDARTSRLVAHLITALVRASAVLTVIACLLATQGFVWLKLQARATQNAQVWLDAETQRDPQHKSRDAGRDELAARINRDFPLSVDERKFITGSGSMPGLSNIAWPMFLLVMVAIRSAIRKTAVKKAAKAPLIAAAVGAMLGTIGAIATFGPLLK